MQDNKQTALSGIKPTGRLTLGNYIGALKNFPSFQEQYHPFIFIADLHALTLPIDPEELRQNTLDIAAFYLASGLDPEKSTIFLQSMVHEHSELATILQNYAYMGEMSRMTQFKDKSRNLNEKQIGLGLFTYPVLMAADIILYDTKVVPVGEDQKQHVELTRDLAIRFNHRYGDVFVVPEVSIPKTGKRIMSLSDPSKKMSKSDPKGDIFLKDDEQTIRKKIMSAVTDMESRVHYDIEKQPGISNLMTIYASLSSLTIEEVEAKFATSNYGTFKREVADLVCSVLIPFQERYRHFLEGDYIDKVLTKGAKEAQEVASRTLKRVKQAIGIYQVK